MVFRLGQMGELKGRFGFLARPVWLPFVPGRVETLGKCLCPKVAQGWAEWASRTRPARRDRAARGNQSGPARFAASGSRTGPASPRRSVCAPDRMSPQSNADQVQEQSMNL